MFTNKYGIAKTNKKLSIIIEEDKEYEPVILTNTIKSKIRKCPSLNLCFNTKLMLMFDTTDISFVEVVFDCHAMKTYGYISGYEEIFNLEAMNLPDIEWCENEARKYINGYFEFVILIYKISFDIITMSKLGIQYNPEYTKKEIPRLFDSCY